MNLVNRIIYEKKAHEMSAEITQQSNTLKWSTNRLAESVGAFLLGGIFIGATVGAALKKVAVSILTNPKALKKVGIAVGSILLAILMPIIAIVSFFTGNFNIDTSGIQQKIEASLTAEQKAQMAEAERF